MHIVMKVSTILISCRLVLSSSLAKGLDMTANFRLRICLYSIADLKALIHVLPFLIFCKIHKK